MNNGASPATRSGFARKLLGGLDQNTVADVVAASGDVAMVIDRGGVIRDVAVSNSDQHDPSSLLDRRWTDLVTIESRPKVEEMLRDAANDSRPRWREINFPTANGRSVSMRYIAINAGEDGRVIAIGRDQRMIAELQQRLVEAQRAMEREYQKLRQAESRYRLLFQLTSEAVLVVDSDSRKVVEANPAAERLIGGPQSLIGRAFAQIFDAESRDDAVGLLATAQNGPNLTAQERLLASGRVFLVAASVFRHEGSGFSIVRLTPDDPAYAAAGFEDRRPLVDVVERMPDAFVVTDEQMRIITVNSAFVELTRLASKEQATGQSLANFLGRPDIDRNILISSLRQHGMLKGFATVVRNRLGETEDVEISAVHAVDARDPCFGFTIRAGRAAQAPAISGAMPRSIEQLSKLVGQVTLKQLLRETTDLVERMCIEAALELTKNNRASAAEILGLSRQSLYSKLHRYGLGDFRPSARS
jgi:transcriptional regulator PpsR